MNKITIIGRLTGDPVLTQTNSGIDKCDFTVAVNRRFKKGEADFFPTVVWRESAVNAHKYLAKGRQVAVSGAVQIDHYEDKGIKKLAVKVMADEIEYLGGGDGVKAPVKDKSTGLAIVEDDEMPF